MVTTLNSNMILMFLVTYQLYNVLNINNILYIMLGEPNFSVVADMSRRGRPQGSPTWVQAVYIFVHVSR